MDRYIRAYQDWWYSFSTARIRSFTSDPPGQSVHFLPSRIQKISSLSLTVQDFMTPAYNFC